MRDFELEVFFSKWEFAAGHHMTASDAESMTLTELRDKASPEDRVALDNLWLGYTDTQGGLYVRDAIATTYSNMQPEHIGENLNLTTGLPLD